MYWPSNPRDAFVLYTGRITLKGNHHRFLSLQAWPKDIPSKMIAVALPANLAPKIGDVDIGAMNGVPVPVCQPGSKITLPVRVNSGVGGLAAMHLLFRCVF